MDGHSYDLFTEALVESLAALQQVIGVVALGSMSGRGTPPDEHSDHDFFIVTQPGAQEALRTHVGWLPPGHRPVLLHRETPHGIKVILQSGHLLELAVFDLDELGVARANRYAVLFDRGGVAARMAAVASKPVDTPSTQWLCGQLLSNVLVAGERAARGEGLSARQFLASHAMACFARLLWMHVPTAGAGVADNLDPLRRVEVAYPEVGRALRQAVDQPLERAASAFLQVASDVLAARVPLWPSEAVAAVQSRLLHLGADTLSP